MLFPNQDNRSIDEDAIRLNLLDAYIGDLPLDKVHMHSLQSFITARKTLGRKTKTINLALGVVRRILNLASSEWVDENGLTWLEATPKIKMFPIRDQRPSYPLSWEEQDYLFSYLPEHLREMALFKVNTGTRQQEVCQLEWAWEVSISGLNSSVFVVPGYLVKNGENRLIVLNHIAKSVIDRQRSKNNKYVFTYKDKPVARMNNKAWINARTKADIKQVRVHDLKHTFGRRLRAAGVSFEDRQDLLGHRSGRITTHYSNAELQNILEAANQACDRNIQGLALITFKQMPKSNLIKLPRSRKSPANENGGLEGTRQNVL